MYLDDLTDAELVGLQRSMRHVLDQAIATPAGRAAIALFNEITRRTHARGLFDESTGEWTEKGRALLGSGS